MSVPGCEFLERQSGRMVVDSIAFLVLVVDSIAFLVLLPMILCGPGGKPLAWTFRAWRLEKAAALEVVRASTMPTEQGLESFSR